MRPGVTSRGAQPRTMRAMDEATVGEAPRQALGGASRQAARQSSPAREGGRGFDGDGHGSSGGDRVGVATSDVRTGSLSGPWLVAAVVGVSLVVAFGIVLRFWTRSALWLDEALTVNIAKLPLHDLPSYLKRDGAPPLYYVLLHFWMGVFGTSDMAIRALSGVISVATLPVAWLAGRRFGGRRVAWAVLVLLASAPFAVYYATEARMYSLVIFLTACGVLAFQRALARPRPGNLAAIAIVTAALLYSQYWAVYLVGTVGIWLIFQMWRGRPEWRQTARWAFGGVVAGCVLFLPWAPIFLYQARYTGTPWAAPANFSAIMSALTGFTDNQATLMTSASDQGRLLAVCYFALAGLGLFGVARGGWHIDLDMRTRWPGRVLAFVVLVTLAVAVTGGIVTHSGFSPRYAAVIFLPWLLLVGLGVLVVVNPRVRMVVLAVVVAAGMAAAVENIWTQRTQAPKVTAVIKAHAHAGDVVAFCPDQLGPAVYRLLPQGRFRTVTFPRRTSAAYVDWVNYLHAADGATSAGFAGFLKDEVGSTHDIWYVFAPGYSGFGSKCARIESNLTSAGFGARQWVYLNPNTYYEPMELVQFAPPTSATSAP